MKTLGSCDPGNSIDAGIDAVDGDSAKLAYLKAGWPGACEDALRDALAILNGTAAPESARE